MENIIGNMTRDITSTIGAVIVTLFFLICAYTAVHHVFFIDLLFYLYLFISSFIFPLIIDH